MGTTRNWQQSRAAVFSVGAHVALLTLLVLEGGLGRTPAPYPADVILAELVTLKAVAPRAPPSLSDDPTLEPAEPTAPPLVEREPPDLAESASPPPPQAPPAPEPEPPPLSSEAQSREAPEPAPPDDTPAVAAETSTEEVAPVPAPAPERPEPARVPALVESADAPASEPLEPGQREMLNDRLASWTGGFEAGADSPTLTWRDHGQRYTAVFKPLPAADEMGMEQLAVEVTTDRDGQRLQTELRMTRVAFSNFAQFVDRWDNDVQIHNDEIDGRFHSNTEIHVSRERGAAPVFHGKVTLAARDIATDGPGWINRRKLFPAGLETGVRRIPLPPHATTLDDIATAEDQVQRFTDDVTVTFYADGSYGWREGDSEVEQRRALGNRPHYLIGGEDVVVQVKGVVNGTVLVYTPAHIVIAGNLVYATDPTHEGADDFLGLVAERIVAIGEPELTGPGDLEVQASIYARRQFAVRDYRSRPSGTLHIYGSLTAGSLTATEPRYATKIEFDDRLEKMRAPGFPLSDRYELESLSGEWRVVD